MARSVEKPFLYRLHMTWGEDEVWSYTALRSVRVEKEKILLNGEPIFLRLVLDQGYDPEGLWTAPSSEALKKDILKAKELGFNGARLHQKVFEPLYFSHADALGFLVFSEYPDWVGGASGRWVVSEEYKSYLKAEAGAESLKSG